MFRTLITLAALAVAPTSAMAHESPDAHGHFVEGIGTFDTVGPRAEYYGHFLRGRVQHGPAIYGGGHLNAQALFPHTGEMFVAPSGDGFVILVTPNLVNRATAKVTADTLAIEYCQKVPGATRVRYGAIERYARSRLESWMFSGRCR